MFIFNGLILTIKEIGINEFCEISMQEDVISERELVEAFRTFDKDENGFISYREFMDIFTNVIIIILFANCKEAYFFEFIRKGIHSVRKRYGK